MRSPEFLAYYKEQNRESVNIALRGIEGNGPNLPLNLGLIVLFSMFNHLHVIVFFKFFPALVFFCLGLMLETWGVRDAYEVAS